MQLSNHFTVSRLLKFAFPSIVMMIFTSIYGVVDGFFVSNFVGKTQFSAVNFIYPLLMILGTLGFMFGTGGSALIAKTMGEGNTKKANSIFSQLVYIAIILGVIIEVVGIIFIEPIAHLLGAEGELLTHSVMYGKILLLSLPLFIVQMMFQSFFVTAEKPGLGLLVTVISGVINMVLDGLFMAVFNWGIPGAAAATAISQAIGGIIPLFYFAFPNKSTLRFTKLEFDFSALLKTCTNGSSEFMSNISMSVVSMLYNIQLLNYAGEDGIAAYGTMMYVNMVFIAVFIGFAIGTAPIIGYHYGAENYDELKGLLKKGLGIISVFSVLMVIAGFLLARPLSELYVGYDKALFEMTVRGFKIFSTSFLFCGFAIFASNFFTALNDGLTSAIISFLRTFVFQIAFVLILPIIFDLDGIWISLSLAEVMAVVISFIFLKTKQKKYNY